MPNLKALKKSLRMRVKGRRVEAFYNEKKKIIRYLKIMEIAGETV